MLSKLFISNFAIIEQTEIAFSPNFNVITGETGAGKSILLGALSLIIGHRADLSQRSQLDKKTVVEALFTIDESLQSFFEENDLDFENETILRRELLTSGKSRAFINDTPVSLTTLKQLTNQLLDLHQQHDSLSVVETDFQRQTLDKYARISQDVNNFHQKFRELKKLQQLLNKKIEAQHEKQKQSDYLQFQYQEL